MKKITQITLTLAIGSLNAFAIWNTCAEFTHNFGMDKKHTQVEISKFESKLNGEAGSVAVN